MRFLLDENVDARVREPIRAEGHDCWTVPESGLAGEEDPNLSVYAHKLGAVIITHDRAFSLKVKRHIVGHHVYLKCKELDAPKVIAARLEDMTATLCRHQDLYLVVSHEGIEITFANQGW